MKSSQWFVLAGIFLIGVIMFQIMANTALKGELMMTETQINIMDKTGEFPEMGVGDIIFPLRHSLYQSFTFLCWLGLMGCLICGSIESHSKKKKEKENFRRIMSDAKDKDFAMKVAQKLKLKHLPQDIPELVYWGKKEGKEKEVDKAIEEKTERWLLSLELFKEKNKRYKPKEMDKEWIAKMKKKYPDEKPYEFADYEM